MRFARGSREMLYYTSYCTVHKAIFPGNFVRSASFGEKVELARAREIARERERERGIIGREERRGDRRPARNWRAAGEERRSRNVKRETGTSFSFFLGGGRGRREGGGSCTSPRPQGVRKNFSGSFQEPALEPNLRNKRRSPAP